MKRMKNGDFVIESENEILEAQRIGREEGLDWIYIHSADGYDGYCVREDCTCTGHIHYND